MKVGFVYAGSWEYAYPQCTKDFDRTVWCQSEDFIMKYPRAVQSYGVEPVFFYLSASQRQDATFTHKYGFRMRRSYVRIGAGHIDREFTLRILRAILREKCDLVHFYSCYRNRLYPDLFDLFALCAAFARLPFVVHYQVGTFPRVVYESRFKQLLLEPRRRIKRAAMARAQRIFSINHLELKRLSDPSHPEYYGYLFPREKLVYLPNIVDPERFYPMDRANARRRLGLDADRHYLLFAGFLREGKGVQHIINALPGVVRSFPDVTLLVVGNGDYEPTLRRLAQDQAVADRVDFRGAVPNDQLCPYYNAADVHILPSHFESFGTVLIESLACHTPSIGAAVGGIREVLDNGLGLLVPPRDEEALQRAILRVLGGAFTIPEERRAEALRMYSYETAGGILHDAYVDILEGRSDGVLA